MPHREGTEDSACSLSLPPTDVGNDLDRKDVFLFAAQQCREGKKASHNGVSKQNPAKPSPRVFISSKRLAMRLTT